MRILALDLATARPCSWALRWGNERWTCGETAMRDMHDFLRHMDIKETHVVCEGAYLGKNAKTYGDLCHVAGVIEGVALALGFAIIPVVPPSEWKASILNFSGCKPKGRKDQKAAALKVAHLLGAKPKDDDQADAVCLAEYVWCRERQKARAR